jgi:AcrR family transcriptional regulator
MAPRTRMSADDRRRSVIEAAMHEFGRAGFDSVPVDAIATRAGVSQPYIFRLFGSKKGLVIASIEERTRQILEAFRAAADAGGDAPLDAMAAAYVEMLASDPASLRCQLHSWAGAHDQEIGDAARASYLAIWKQALTLGRADGETIRDFMAQGMLLTVLAALDLGELLDDPSLNDPQD